MRPDMFELLLERPRAYRGCRSRKAPPYPRAHLAPRSLNEAPLLEAYGQRYRERSLNENLAPLVRWLHRQVGRPYRLVYAELSRQLSPSSAVKQHVRDHVRDYVATSVVELGGVLHGQSRHGLLPLGLRRVSLYVCPRTDLLRLAPRPTASSAAARQLDDARYLIRRGHAARPAWQLVTTTPRSLTTDGGRGVCAFTGLALSSSAYRAAVLGGKLPWGWSRVAIHTFTPGKALLATLFREAERVAREAERVAREARRAPPRPTS